MNGFLYMAMTDYPYPSSFLQPMPGWPINRACDSFKDVEPLDKPVLNTNATMLSDRENLLLNTVKDAADIYFNYTGVALCTNTSDTDATGALDGDGWNVLACNELAMPTAMAANSMFLAEPFNYTTYTQFCQEKYGLTPYYEWALDTFGGWNQTKDFKSYSNIIFSNGVLDPWMAGGVTEFINADMPVFQIKGAAHHLDLRLPVDSDKGTEVDYYRQLEALFIEKWIRQYQGMEIGEVEVNILLKLQEKSEEKEEQFIQ